MRTIFTPAVLAVALATAAPLYAESAATVPVGMVTVTAAAGTGVNKVRTFVSAPLLGSAEIQGISSGRISSITANSIQSSSAGWQAGELSAPATPYIVRITSGQAKGLTLLISTATPNTADTFTIDSGEASFVNLTSLGIAVGSSGDTFQIYPCDTLQSLFGTPETTGVVGGTVPAGADTVVISNTFGNPSTYFYSTTSDTWVRQAFGNPPSPNTPIRPDSGIAYFRIGNTPLELVLLGTVPSTDRQALIKNSGVTYFSNSWPTDQTLSQLNLQNVPNWTSGASPSVADIAVVGTQNFYFDGTNWRRQAFGNPIQDPTVPAGQSILIVKKGTATGAAVGSDPIPYDLTVTVN